MATTKPKKIRALVGLRKLPEGDDQRSSRRLSERLDRERHGFSEAAHRIGGLPGCEWCRQPHSHL